MIVRVGKVERNGVLAASARVLVVDDDELILATISEVLDSEGYDVRAAPNGQAALEMAAQCAPLALLVTDVCMPGIDGRELARRLRARFSTLPVLMISGSEIAAEWERSTADPPTRFLAKPFSVETFLSQVDELTGHG